MKTYIEIIGPCSKWVEGKGWVTQIPIQLILQAGFSKNIPENNNVSENTLDYTKSFSSTTKTE